MINKTKHNVAEFNSDVNKYGGYQYSSTSRYSSVVSNKRLNDATTEIVRSVRDVKSILDAGCGDGTYTADLKRRLPEIEITGFDPAVQAISSAIQRFPDCTFAVGNVLDPSSFPKGTFDLVLFRGVLHHLPVQRQAVEHALDVSSRVLIIEPNGNNPIVKWLERNSDYHIRHEEQSFTSDHLVALCESVGLSVHRLLFVGFVPFFFPTILARTIYFIQPLLERIPFVAKRLAGQIIIYAERC